MSERLEAAAAGGLPENRTSKIRRAVVLLPATAVLAILAVSCNDEASELVNISEFECETSGFKILVDGEGYEANQLRLTLSSDILTDDLEEIFREEQLCVAVDLSLGPSSYTVRVPESELEETIDRRDDAIERFEGELGSGVEEVAKLEGTKFE